MKDAAADAITSFTDEYAFLSNFERVPGGIHVGFHLGGPKDIVIVDTVEHAYQASKATTKKDFLKIAFADGPSAAKGLGRRVRLPHWWDTMKLQIMESHVRQKFIGRTMKTLLLSTGTRDLIEGNWWGDDFWGVIDKTGRGENHLGRILMRVRDDIRAGGRR